MLKRTFDFVVSLFGLILLFPFGVIVIIAIVLFSGFPIFFIQPRIGQNFKNFKLLKFRTMTVNTETKSGTFEAGNQNRITPIGRILRKTKLDELPQLMNVLKGDMSLVGPRPEVKKWVDCYRNRWAKILTVKPGITDNASIKFRNEEKILTNSNNPELCYRNEILPQKLDLYELYVENHSFRGDLLIIFKTFRAVIFK